MTSKHSPQYFSDCLLALHTVHSGYFEQFTAALWKQYENEELYLEWLQLVNEVFLNLQIDSPTSWNTLSSLFELTYKKLTEGNYPLKEIKEMMPDFYMNWIRVTSPSQSLFAATATLAWHEMFPASLNSYTVQFANKVYQHCSYDQDGLDYFTTLYRDVMNWAESMEIPIVEEWRVQGDSMINNTAQSNSEKVSQLLAGLKQKLQYIWEEQKKHEQEIADAINWNEEIVRKLNGFIANLKEMEQEKIVNIVHSYNNMKETLKADLQENIPLILKGCREIIKEDSDFSRLHIELNEEMNKRISNYLQERITHYFALDAHNWVTHSSEEFIEVESYLTEMCQTFNVLYQEEKLNLKPDFHILDDWHRDINRMTSRVKINELNILLRFTPSQALLKGAGKLISPLVQNKSALYTRYKKYIKTRSYEEVTETILNSLFVQFELFESALDRDVSMLFDKIFKSLYQLVQETNKEISLNKAELQKLLASPEAYGDPLTLFDLRLHQYELITSPKQQILSEEV